MTDAAREAISIHPSASTETRFNTSVMPYLMVHR